MTDEEIRSEIQNFTADIRRWIAEGDYNSAAIISRALTTFIVDIKKQKAESRRLRGAES